MYRAPSGDGASSSPNTRIVVVGGGFGGAYVVRHLERLFRGRTDVEIVLVSRDNFFLMTPLLFEACSGTLDFRHCSVPIRDFLRRARFVEATVQHIDWRGVWFTPPPRAWTMNCPTTSSFWPWGP